jgi:FkbM family methyltransferase
MTLFSLLQHICDHPLNRNRKAGAALDFVRWQVRSRLAGKPLVYTWINDARVLVRRGETGFTMNIYCGLYDFHEMAYLLHVLRPGDLFGDIGANIGSYTLLASAVRCARAVCFEPIPETYARLEKNLQLNHLEKLVVPHNLGVGDQPGVIRFSLAENCCNHVLREGEQEEGLAVKVVTLDDVLGNDCPNLIKIDVEGFEQPVLKGAPGILQNPALHSIILELNGDESGYGFHASDTVDLLKQHGFSSYAYDPFQRKLTLRDPLPGNVLFIRHLDKVETLLHSSEKFFVKNVAV